MTLLQAWEHIQHAIGHVTAEDIQSFRCAKKNNKDVITPVAKVMANAVKRVSMAGVASDIFQTSFKINII